MRILKWLHKYLYKTLIIELQKDYIDYLKWKVIHAKKDTEKTNDDTYLKETIEDVEGAEKELKKMIQKYENFN